MEQGGYIGGILGRGSCRAPCRALRELRAELHQRLYQKLCQKLCTELPQSPARSSLKALRGAPSKEHTARPVLPKAPVVLAKALKPRLVVRRKLGVTENFSTSNHAEFMHMPCIYK